MPRRAVRIHLALTVAALAAMIHAAWANQVASTTTWLVTGALGVFCVATAIAILLGATALKRAIAALLLATLGGVVAASLAGHNPLPIDPAPDARYAVFQLVLLSFAIIGIARGWFLSRWLALGLAAAGILSSGLNLAAWHAHRAPTTWGLAVNLSGSLLLLATLASRDVRDRFIESASSVWTSRDPVVRSIRWTIVAMLAATPMLLVYAWRQAVAPQTAVTAIVLAGFLLVSVGFAARRLVVGAIGLIVGGVALLAQAGTTIVFAHQTSAMAGSVSLYYAAFWIPAGLIAVYCGLKVAGPTLRLLRKSQTSSL